MVGGTVMQHRYDALWLAPLTPNDRRVVGTAGSNIQRNVQYDMGTSLLRQQLSTPLAMYLRCEQAGAPDVPRLGSPVRYSLPRRDKRIWRRAACCAI